MQHFVTVMKVSLKTKPLCGTMQPKTIAEKWNQHPDQAIPETETELLSIA